jgi:hypothetical protein
VSACLQWGFAGEESAALAAGHVAIAGREELARLTGMAGAISDVSETVMITGPKPMPDLAFRHFYSKALELARIENILPGGFAIIYFVDKHNRRVRAQIGKDLFALDPETSERWLSMQNLFAGAVDENATPRGEVYFAGTEGVHDRACALFLVALPGGGFSESSGSGLKMVFSTGKRIGLEYTIFGM